MHNQSQLTLEQRIRRAKESNHGLRLDCVDVCELKNLFKTKQVQLDDYGVSRRCKKAVDKSQQLRLSNREVEDFHRLLNLN